MRNNKSYAQIQEFLGSADLMSLPKLNIVILRNIMLEPMEPYLKYCAYQMGCNAHVTFGEYDNVFQEAVGGSNNLCSEDVDCVLVFLKLETLSWDLARNFMALNNDQIVAEKKRVQEFISNVLTGIRNQTKAMILWHGFEVPVYPAAGIVDSQGMRSQTNVINELNEFLKDSIQKEMSAYYVDLNLCLSRIGAMTFYDSRYWYIGKAPYSREALQEIANEDFKFIRSIKGKTKKCLVIDCDNTLWGGIIGEDGLEGIQLSRNTYPGSAYWALQQEILNLYHRGVILALCSKNNEDDVWEVFSKHSDMLLKEEHIATSQINWQNKADNLRQIASDLNIGLDSLVMLDDSEFEVDHIRQALPEVTVIHMSKEVCEYRNMLVSCGLFDTLTLSEEDNKRGALYKAEVARTKLKIEKMDIVQYYTSLDMIVTVRFADAFSIPRIAQLTQKTNQFNLTTKRYSEADIKAFAQSDTADVIYLQLRDRYGDSGIVGVSILKYMDDRAVLDTFLLSCRVLGRGVEDALMVQALKLARLRERTLAIGKYYATRKNEQVKHFYCKQGFEMLDDDNDAKTFAIALDIFDKHEPSFFKRIDSDVNTLERERGENGYKKPGL